MRLDNMNIELFYILSYCCICLPKYQDSNLERKLPTFTELPFTTHILKVWLAFGFEPKTTSLTWNV